MDELPSIKPLSATQLRIREALRSAQPLNVSKPSMDKDFIVFDYQNNAKPKTNSLFDRFLRHKINNSKNAAPDESPTKRKNSSQHKWSQLKDNMTQELETKRLESQKIQELNDKLENEELIDSDEELEKKLEEVVEDSKHDNEDNDNESDLEESEVEDTESSEEEEEEDQIEDNECDDSQEDNGSDRQSNPFINDEAVDEDEEEVSEEEVEEQIDRQTEKCIESEDKICSEVEKDLNLNFAENEVKDDVCHQNSQSVEDEECKDNELNDSVFNCSVNSMDESYSERRFATQKIALSPFMTQKLKSRLNFNQEFPELITKLDTNAEEFDSQTLLGLCSGNFSQIKTEDKVGTDEDIDLNPITVGNEDPVENKEDFSQTKRVRKVFNIESDGESDLDEEVNDQKSLDQNKQLLKNFNESDGEELVVTEAEVSDEEEEELDNTEADEEVEEQEEEEVEHDIQKIGKSFFDNEAELSGSDVSSDEEDGDGDDAYDVEEVDPEELHSEAELRDQIGRIHNKNLLDEDKRQLMIMKELMFEDGDLHDDDEAVREKKFRWNFETDGNFVNDYINEDSNDNYMDSDEDIDTKTPALKMSFQNSDTGSTIDKSLEKLKSKSKPNRNTGSEAKNVNSLSTFLLKDQRLNAILKPNPKRNLSAKNAHSIRSNKRFKSSNKSSSKPSIFDLMNQN